MRFRRLREHGPRHYRTPSPIRPVLQRRRTPLLKRAKRSPQRSVQLRQPGFDRRLRLGEHGADLAEIEAFKVIQDQQNPVPWFKCVVDISSQPTTQRAVALNRCGMGRAPGSLFGFDGLPAVPAAHRLHHPNPGGVGRIACRSCLLYTSPSPRDLSTSRMPSSA